MEPKLAEVVKLKDFKKDAATYLRSRAEELDAIMARNYSAKNYTMAAGDARQLAAILDVLGQIELS